MHARTAVTPRASLGGSKRPAREAAKDAVRAVVAANAPPDVVERRVRALESHAWAREDLERWSNGVWRVVHSTAPPPSNGVIGPFRGESFQVVDVASRRYENALSVPPESWLRVALAARYETTERVDVWKVTFESVEVRVFDRFVVLRKEWGDGEATRVWRTTFVDEDVRVVRAGRTLEAVEGGRARGRNAVAGDEDDCLFVMTREVPWWEIPA